MGLSYSQFIGADSSASCVTDGNIFEDQYFLTIGGILSSICYLYILYLYFVKKLPTLMRHPSTLAVHKCIFELLFTQQYIWIPFIANKFLYKSDSNGDCFSTPLSGFLSFCSEFFLLGGELWFAVISMDLQMCYSNPFSSFNLYQNYYLTLIWGLSLLLAILLVCCGPKAYGVSSIGVVWIQDRKGQDNYMKIVFFYSIMAIVYAYCLFTVLSLSVKMKRGFADTLNVRLSIMQRSRAYIIGYSIFWAALFSMELASYFAYKDLNSTSLSNDFVSGAAYCFAFRGVWALLMILGPNWKDLSREDLLLLGDGSKTNHRKDIDKTVQEGLLMKPHLNSALRAEILYFTTHGIMISTKECMRVRHQADMERLSTDGERFTEEDARDSSFSFKDVLERSSSVSLTGHPSYLSMGWGASTQNSVSTSQKRISTKIEGVSSKTADSDIQGRVQQQSNMIHQSVLLEVERTLRDMGENGTMRMDACAMPETNASLELPDDRQSELFLGLPSVSAKVPAPSKYQIEMQARPSDALHDMLNSSSPYDRRADFINSPFYDHQQMEDEFRQRDNSVVSGESQRSTSSQSTVKWADTTDLHFRMVQNVSAKSNSSSGPSESLWLRTDKDVDLKDKKPVSRSEHLANSFFEMFSRATKAATNAVSGAYDEFSFTDYSSRLFATVREMCGVDSESYTSAFERTANENFSEGRSGAFMFCSANLAYVVKTTTHSEVQALLRILPDYINHLRRNPNTLLIKFLGAYCITMYSTKLYFVVMSNVFPKERLSEKFDLKGSWVNRFGNLGEKLTRRERLKKIQDVKSVPLYQDNDLQQKICLKEDVSLQLMEQVDRDTKFLCSANLMDYSLLIGVVRRNFEVKRGDPTPRASLGQIDTARETVQLDAAGNSLYSTVRISEAVLENAEPGIAFETFQDGMHAEVVEAPGTYYIGLIDVLQEWNFSKKMERFYKVYILGNEQDGISAIEPVRYKSRFMQRVIVDVFEGLDSVDLSAGTARDPSFKTLEHGSPSETREAAGGQLTMV